MMREFIAFLVAPFALKRKIEVTRVDYQDEKGEEIDEVILENVERLHLERLDNGHIWICAESEGDRIVINLYTPRNGKIKGVLEKQ